MSYHERTAGERIMGTLQHFVDGIPAGRSGGQGLLSSQTRGARVMSVRGRSIDDGRLERELNTRELFDYLIGRWAGATPR